MDMKPTRIASLVSLSLLGACSSGGGGIPPVPTEPIAITEENAALVAAGMPMTASLIEFQDTMGFETLTSEGTGTYDGPSGGSITAGFDVDVAPLGVVSSGDRFSVSFDNCMLNPTSTLDGGVVLDFNTITGDWQVDDVWAVDVGFQINALTFSSGPATGFFDGNWDQSATFDTGDATFSLAGDFTTSFNDGTGWKSAALNGLVLSWGYDALAAEATYSVDGQFASTELGGAVTLTTLAPFVMGDADANPHTGSVRATGDAGSTLTFTVLDETFVRLDVDADGDGLDEFSVTLTWFELEG